MIKDEDGLPIYNATIQIFQLVNDHWQYIDHDVISSRNDHRLISIYNVPI